METIDLKEITIVPHKALGITLYTGTEVLDLLAEEGFQAEWDRLYEACSWATVFQSRAYVATWYRLYREKHLPILIESVEGNKLKGLLAVAALNNDGQSTSGKSKTGRIVGAGHFDAEYQVWLAEEADGDRFIREALLELKNQFPGFEVRFRYLPPKAPLKWIEADRQWKSNCVLQSFRRPLIDINEANASKMVCQHEFKRKFNKLKKEGELKQERILDPDAFGSMIHELVTQYDFRQGARFNKNNFRDDPLKEMLFLKMFEQNLLHVSVLKLDEKILASVVSIAGRDCVHLSGINTHSPVKAKYYSFGILQFRLLVQQLQKEGFTRFDLTPGGDSYKDRMATGHDQVQELLISHSYTSRLKRKIRKRAYSQMIKGGIWPMGAEVALRKKVYLLKARLKMIKEQGIFQYMVNRAKELIKPGRQLAYLLQSQRETAAMPVVVNRDSLQDLLDYEARGTWTTRWEFLEDAMRRLEVGERAYTWSEGGRLLGCAWLADGPTPGIQYRKGQPGAKGALLLQQVYCHPEGRSRLEGFLTAVATQAARDCGEGPLYALAPERDQTLCRALEALGFQKMSGF